MGIETAIILSIAATATSTGLAMYAQHEAGKQADEVAKANALNRQIEAENARTASEEEARNKQDEGRHFIATQKATAAAGNIMLNVGAPLVIEADTRNILAREKGYILKRGRDEANYLTNQANIELAIGKNAKSQANKRALAIGIAGVGSIAGTAADAGWFKQGSKTSNSSLFGGSTNNFSSSAWKTKKPVNF